MIYHVYANQSNVGDWLSARGIQALLAPVRVRELFCDEPFVADTLEALSDATPDDLIIIGGGGLFMDYFVPFWEGFLPIAARVPFVVWGAGCCDMKREHTRPPLALVSGIVRQSRLCIVRDELTRAQLGREALPSAVVCPTVNAVPTARADGHRLLHVDHHDNVGPEIYALMVAAGESFAKCTGRSYRQTNNLIPAGHEGALRNTLDLYASADLVLTSRLHGCIIGLATGRRVLAVSGDHKVEAFMSVAGLSDWVCDLDDLDSLPVRLERLPEQTVPAEFIETGRRQNAAVAEKVKTLMSRGGLQQSAP